MPTQYWPEATVTYQYPASHASLSDGPDMKEDGGTVRPDPVPTSTLGPIHASTSDHTAALKKRAREFDRAIYADFTWRAQSEQASALIGSIFNAVTDYEVSAGTRTNKRGKTAADLRLTVEAFTADLIKAQAISESTHRYVYREMRPKAFTGEDVGHRVFIALVDAMKALGLVEVYPGSQKKIEGFGGGPVGQYGKATRFRASPQLLRLCERHGVVPAEFGQHFLQPLPTHPLQVTDASTWTQAGRKVRGKPRPYTKTSHTEALEREVIELNNFLDTMELENAEHRGYRRIFHKGNGPEFNWNMGGRLYGSGINSYQQLSLEDRLRMRINGEPVCEIDVRASYLTVFHGWLGQELDPSRDPYDVPGLGPKYRGLVKIWVSASFGQYGHITGWPRELLAAFKRETRLPVGRQFSTIKVGKIILAHYPLLSQIGTKINGRRAGWAELMFCESEAILKTMTDLMSLGVPSLTVHDSIIVPRSRHRLTRQILEGRYFAHCGATPLLQDHLPG